MRQKKYKRKKRKSELGFPIVGVGASAGGLEAFKKFFGALPKEPGLAFVLIQHLDPKYKSHLPVLISQITEMPVCEATKNIYIKKNHVYIAPPNRDPKVIKGKLIVDVRRKKVGPHLPIDHFFNSLAQDQGARGIGVILSGTASDGTLGLEAIKAHGGITFAQDVASAGFVGMPTSAIQSGCVDFILPPQKIAEELVWIALHPYVRLRYRKKTKEIAPAFPDEMGELDKIFLLINRSMDIDFSNYKHATIQRRIKRRMILKRISTLDKYVKYLQIHADEVQKLGEDFLILVTDFFREPKAYEALRKKVFPKLIKSIKKNQPARLWVAGCSTGEEAYSLAIELLDYLKDESSTIRVQLFATDVSEAAISKARRAIFPHDISKNIPPARFKRYFIKVREGYQVHKSIREMCIFAKHDLIKDPPFSRIDLISCRNVLIYMKTDLQKKILSMFHHALSHKGCLFLGYSESVGTLSNLYGVLDRKNRLYFKKPPQGRSTFEVKDRKSEVVYGPDIVSLKKEAGNTKDKKTKKTRLRSVIQGESPSEKLMIANEELQTSNEELQSANEELTTLNEEVQNKNIELITLGNDLNNLLKSISIPIIMLSRDLHIRRYTPMAEKIMHVVPADIGRPISDVKLKINIPNLKELFLRVIKQQHIHTDEVQGQNRRWYLLEIRPYKNENNVVSGAIILLRDIHFAKIARLKLLAAQRLSEAIINTVREPLIILDSKLRIRLVNQSFLRTFRVSDKSIKNKLIYSIGNGQWNIPALRALLEGILPKKTFFNNYEVSHRFETIGQRIMLLNARRLRQKKGTKDLILLAVEDITKQRESEMKIRKIEKQKHQEKIRSLTSFSSGIVHELNNPLSGCVGLLDVVLRDTPIKNDENYKTLKEISEQLVRSTALVKELLEFSKVGKLSEKRNKVNIHQIISTALMVVSTKFKEAGIHVQKEYGKTVPLIWGIKNRLEQVFINILSNAYIAVTSKGTKGQITIKTDKTRAAVKISVSDTGIGIKQQDISKIFMPFFAGEKTSTGTGLGLTISQGIIDTLGGDIQIKSKRGKGTTVFISLPLHKRAEEAK